MDEVRSEKGEANMDFQEEAIELLRKIREQQEEHHQEWKSAVEEAKLEQQKAQEEVNKVGRSASRKVWVYFCAVIVIFLIFSFGERMLFRISDFLTGNRYEKQSFLQQGKHYEAQSWIDRNQNISPLAGNRFNTKEESMQFIEKLYEAGAEGVYVVNVYEDEMTLKDEGGPYADSLVLILPNEKEKRKMLFNIYAQESKREGFDSESDYGQRELFFWWD